MRSLPSKAFEIARESAAMDTRTLQGSLQEVHKIIDFRNSPSPVIDVESCAITQRNAGLRQQ